MSLRTTLYVSLAGAFASAALLVGCSTGITSSTSLADALSLLSQQVAADPVLNQLTVGDVVQAFEGYTGQLSGSDTESLLTADQESQLQDLQAQLDSGAITQDQFAQQVLAVIGDLAPGRAFAGRGMMGGPFRGDPATQLADQLQLTDEQRQQAQDIFQRLHDDIDTLRQNAHDQIKALLTSDQLTQLEQLEAQFPGPGGPDGGPAGPRGLHGGPSARGGADAGVDPLANLASELQLTADQQTAIEQIRADLRTAIEARHQQARDEFRAILTADQQTSLDQIEAEHQPPQQ